MYLSNSVSVLGGDEVNVSSGFLSLFPFFVGFFVFPFFENQDENENHFVFLVCRIISGNGGGEY